MKFCVGATTKPLERTGWDWVCLGRAQGALCRLECASEGQRGDQRVETGKAWFELSEANPEAKSRVARHPLGSPVRTNESWGHRWPLAPGRR
jgi:hypothetical protein